MRMILTSLAVAAVLAGASTIQAQNPGHAKAGEGHHMAMMLQHHSVATVDLLVAHRDSLKLTEDQLKKLADLREHFAQAEGHAMHGTGMGSGMMMGQGKARLAFDRVPGKMIPRVHRAPAEHCPMCPFAILTPAQREQAHQLLGHRQGHQHQS